jgi:hypothetical protein
MVDEPYESKKGFSNLAQHLGWDEQRHGKLTAIKVEGAFTVATFQTGPTYPAARRVTLRKDPDGTAAPDDGYVLVCKGEVWVDKDTKSKVIAIRKKP